MWSSEGEVAANRLSRVRRHWLLPKVWLSPFVLLDASRLIVPKRGSWNALISRLPLDGINFDRAALY